MASPTGGVSASELQSRSHEQLPIDTTVVDVDDSKQKVDVEELGAAEIVDALSSTATAHDEFTTTRKELWSFYLYYVVSPFAFNFPVNVFRAVVVAFTHVLTLGFSVVLCSREITVRFFRVNIASVGTHLLFSCIGLSGFNFGPSQFQNLLYLAGYDPSQAPFTTPCGDGDCVLPYLGKIRDGEHPIHRKTCRSAYPDQWFSISKLDCAAYEWHKFCHSGRTFIVNRRMGGLRTMEVSTLPLRW